MLASARDEESFRALVERHSRAIFRVAFGMTRNEQDAEDVVQETFMRAYRAMAQFENRADVGTWLYRIGVNCALDYLQSRHRHAAGREPIDSVATRDSRALRATDPLPDRIVFGSEIQKQIARSLGELTPRERAAFVLRHFEGCAIEEVAQILNVRADAAKHTIFRAVKKLRKALAPVVGPTV